MFCGAPPNDVIAVATRLVEFLEFAMAFVVAAIVGHVSGCGVCAKRVLASRKDETQKTKGREKFENERRIDCRKR